MFQASRLVKPTDPLLFSTQNHEPQSENVCKFKVKNGTKCIFKLTSNLCSRIVSCTAGGQSTNPIYQVATIAIGLGVQWLLMDGTRQHKWLASLTRSSYFGLVGAWCLVPVLALFSSSLGISFPTIDSPSLRLIYALKMSHCTKAAVQE